MEDEIDKGFIELQHFIQRRGGDLAYLMKKDIVDFYWHVRKMEEDLQREIDQAEKLKLKRKK